VKTGHATDVRLDAGQLSARLHATERQIRRMVDKGFPAPHYIGERRRWWLSEVQAWEATHATRSRPAAVTRGAGNLIGGGAGETSQ
jgi:predicted DNA-binding transcriptional regulator AlpA